MDGAIAIAVVAEIVWQFSLSFSITWAVLYVSLGSWAKVRYRNPKARPEKAIRRRYGPVIVSHILYSVLFANPFCIFFLMWNLGDIAEDAAHLENLPRFLSGLAVKYSAIEPIVVSTFYLMVVSAYFVLMSLLTDFLVLRLSTRVRYLKWLGYKADLPRWILVHMTTITLLLVVVWAVSWGLYWILWPQS